VATSLIHGILFDFSYWTIFFKILLAWTVVQMIIQLLRKNPVSKVIQ
jgi:hypothetical protein